MSDVLHTEKELTIRFTHPRIKNHRCIHKGLSGWRADGTPVPCSCVDRVLKQEWFKFFPFKRIGKIQFTPESVTATEA